MAPLPSSRLPQNAHKDGAKTHTSCLFVTWKTHSRHAAAWDADTLPYACSRPMPLQRPPRPPRRWHTKSCCPGRASEPGPFALVLLPRSFFFFDLHVSLRGHALRVSTSTARRGTTQARTELATQARRDPEARAELWRKKQVGMRQGQTQDAHPEHIQDDMR